MTSSISSGLDPYIEKAMNPGVAPTPKQLLLRLGLATPILITGGAVSTYLVGKVSSLAISPFAGAFVGGAFVLIWTATTVFCKAFDFDNESTVGIIAKVATDVALTILTSSLVFAAFGVESYLLKATLCIPLSLIGAFSIGVICGIYFNAMDTLMTQGFDVPPPETKTYIT